MDARIYRQRRSHMQAGRAKANRWVVELLKSGRRTSDPLMGWTSIDDTRNQVELTFETREEAIAYARRAGLNFTVEEPRKTQRLVKSYAENFAADRKRPWTH